MTARSNETSEQMYESYGIGYTKKPFEVNDFKEIVGSIANSKQKYSKKTGDLRFCS